MEDEGERGGALQPMAGAGGPRARSKTNMAFGGLNALPTAMVCGHRWLPPPAVLSAFEKAMTAVR